MRKRAVCEWMLCEELFLGGILFLVPVILTIIGSFLLKGELSFHKYSELFLECFPFYRMFWNSVCITIGSIVIAIPAAYAFKFARFRGKNVLYVIYIVIMLMPLQVMVLPNYIGLRDMKLLNSPLAIILPLLFSPLAVVVWHQYMKECDVQMVEAARLETNSCIQIIWHCIVPQIKVCVFAVGLLVFRRHGIWLNNLSYI